MRAFGRCPFQSEDAGTRIHCGDLAPRCDDRARKVVAQHHRKLARAEKRQQPQAVAFGAAHVDGIDRGRLHGNLKLVGVRTPPRHLTDVKSYVAGRSEAKQCGSCLHDLPQFVAGCASAIKASRYGYSLLAKIESPVGTADGRCYNIAGLEIFRAAALRLDKKAPEGAVRQKLNEPPHCRRRYPQRAAARRARQQHVAGRDVSKGGQF